MEQKISSFSIHPDTLEFDLPPELIAQSPLIERDQARLMIVDKSTGALRHGVFADVAGLLRAGDVLVVNKARVNRAKLIGKKDTGGRVEIIFIAETDRPRVWRALARRLMKEGTAFQLGRHARAKLVGRAPNGECLIECDADPRQLMEEEGALPLPPYIKRETADSSAALDAEGYQTVYASAPGSVAAPTAGLHFSEALMNRLRAGGVNIVEVLLHVGWGTFKPIANTLAEHVMLPERYEITAAARAALTAARREGRRIIAVGTTSTRVLESQPLDAPSVDEVADTSLFIRPGFSFKWVSGLITNFHVPRSTPISLTAAFVGLNNLKNAYAVAIAERYRFYSYGDAMIII